MFMPRHQNEEENHKIKTANKSFEKITNLNIWKGQ